MFRIFKIIIFALTFLSVQNSEAQEKLGRLPLGLKLKLKSTISEIIMPSVDSAVIKNNIKERELLKTKAPIIAYNFHTAFSPLNCGQWGKNDGFRTWQVKLRSSGANALALVFKNVKLLEGEKLYIYNNKGVRGPFDEENTPGSGTIPLNFLSGDEIIVEYNVPEKSLKTGTFIIETVSHAYDDYFYTQEPGLCNIDISCPEGEAWQKEKRAVVRMVIFLEAGSKLCTGTLINNTAQDSKPYVITASHCISSSYEADRTVFTFNYEKQSCRGTSGNEDQEITGSTLLATSADHDFSLLELYSHPPVAFKPYYAGWDISDKNIDHVTCVHHPWGNTKKISIYNEKLNSSDFEVEGNYAPNSFWKIKKWYKGVTEAGSSGAPLFNKNFHLIGTLTGGSSKCGVPFNDYFSMLSQNWQPSSEINAQIKHWLDPLSYETNTLNAYEPFKGINLGCDTISNISGNETRDLLIYTPGTGYFSGFNSDSITSFAERFSAADSMMLNGALLDIAKVNRDASGGIIVSVNADEGGLPGASLFETYIPYEKLITNSPTYIEFYPFVPVKGNYFISYTLKFTPLDTFGLRQANWRNNSNTTAYLKLHSGWAPINSVSPGGAGSSFGIKAISCKNIPQEPEYEDKEHVFFYPNPADSHIKCNYYFSPAEKLQVWVFDLQGRIHPVNYMIQDRRLEINISELKPGMFIIKVESAEKNFVYKFIKK